MNLACYLLISSLIVIIAGPPITLSIYMLLTGNSKPLIKYYCFIFEEKYKEEDSV